MWGGGGGGGSREGELGRGGSQGLVGDFYNEDISSIFHHLLFAITHHIYPCHFRLTPHNRTEELFQSLPPSPLPPWFSEGFGWGCAICERKALLAGEAPIRIPGRRKPGWLSAWCLQREQFLCFSPPIVCSHSPHLSFSLSSHTALLLFMKKKGVVGKCSQNEITCL